MREARPTSPCHPRGVCVTLLITAVGSCTQVARDVQAAWRRGALRSKGLRERASVPQSRLRGVPAQAPFGEASSGGGGEPGRPEHQARAVGRPRWDDGRGER